MRDQFVNRASGSLMGPQLSDACLPFGDRYGMQYSWTTSPSTRVAWTATAYDAIGQVIDKISAANDGTAIGRETYVYAANTGLLQSQTTLDGVTTTFAYDAIGQLTSQTRNGAITTFTYDGTGNRTAVATDSGTATYVTGTGATGTPKDNRLLSDGTWTYARLAEHIGRPAAVRAVGAANGANPIAVFVPCHRVIAANGTLWGYGGGLDRKRWLLEHEGAAFVGSRAGELPGMDAEPKSVRA